VYSGRRGIHLWISDREAMELTDEQRRALVGWMTVIQGGKEMHKKVNVRQDGAPLPPSIEDFMKYLMDVFESLILGDQDCFASKKGWEALLQLLPDKRIVSTLRAKWEGDEDLSSKDKWEDLRQERRDIRKDLPRSNLMQAALEDVILQYTYPRLDAEVSKHRNHLLKAPFCVHPKTGRVCVPVDPATVNDFDPESVPTVMKLLEELDKKSIPVDTPAENGEHHSDWEDTSLKPYVDMLDKHVLKIMDEVRRNKRGASDLSW